MTVSPTMATASQKRNVIPALCEVTVDCRLLPGQTQAEAEQGGRAGLGAGGTARERGERAARGAAGGRMGGPLGDGIAGWVAETEPEAGLAPICLSGFTDSHWMRD